MGVAEGEEAVVDDHADHRVGALAAAVEALDGGKEFFRVHGRAQVGQFVREDVEQHLGVATGVEMAEVVAREFVGELRGVGQVAIVGDDEAVGRVDVERLRLGAGAGAGGGVAHVADGDVAAQLGHAAVVKDVAHESVFLAQVEPAFFARGDPRGVLPAVLQDGQRVVNGVRGVGLGARHHSCDSAHG